MNRILTFLLALVYASAACAQSSPGFSYGQVPTAGQWNAAFASKQDYLGFLPLNSSGGSMTGELFLGASGPGSSGLNMGVGVSPGAPSNGDIWMTSAGLYYQSNGVVIGPITTTVNLSSQVTGVLSAANGGTGLTAFNLSGNTSTFATTTGALTGGHCVQIDSLGNLEDSGAACSGGSGGSGTVTSGAANTLTYYSAAGTTVASLSTGFGVLTALSNPVDGPLGFPKLNSASKLVDKVYFQQPVVNATAYDLAAHSTAYVPMSDFMTPGQPDGQTDNSADFAKLQAFCGNASNSNVSFTASITGTTLTVTAVGTGSGPIAPGAFLSGGGVTANTYLVSQLSGTTGGVGTYSVNLSQTVGSETMNAMFQNVRVTLAALHYKVKDVGYTCGIDFRGVRGGQRIPVTSPVVPPAGTVIEYTGQVDHAFRFSPVGWPSITADKYVRTPRFEDVTFYTSDQTTPGFPLEFWGTFNPIVTEVDFAGENNNLIDYYGGFGGVFHDIHSDWVNGIGLLFRGDLAGIGYSGSSCTVDSSCGTRLDVPLIDHVNLALTSGGYACYALQGFVQTPEMQHTSCEGGQRNLYIACPTVSGGNLSECPNFFRGVDVQGEFQTYMSVDASDFTDFRCTLCYAVGAPGGSAPAHDIYARLINYSAVSGGGGGFYWTDGTIYNAGYSCFEADVSDVHVTGGYNQYCNFTNHGSGGIEFGNVTGQGNDSVDGTVFCYVNGAGDSGSSSPMGGILVDSPTNNVLIGPSVNVSRCVGATIVGGAQIGQFLSAAVSGTSLTSGTPVAMTSLTLPAGQYECFGQLYTHPAGGATQSLVQMTVSASSAAIAASPGTASNGAASQTGAAGLLAGPEVFVNTGSTTVYANAEAVFSAGTLTADALVGCVKIK